MSKRLLYLYICFSIEVSVDRRNSDERGRAVTQGIVTQGFVTQDAVTQGAVTQGVLLIGSIIRTSSVQLRRNSETCNAPKASMIK